MSGYKPVGAEILFASYQAATISVVSASAVTITAGWPAITIPAGYWTNDRGDWCSSTRFRYGGFLTATATIPTWAFGIAWTQAEPAAFSSAAPLATISNTVTPSAGSGSWKAEVDIGLRTLGLGAATTLVTHGEFSSNLFGSTTVVLAPGGSGNTVTTINKNLNTYIWPYILLGAATAGNQVTTQFGKLMGEN